MDEIDAALGKNSLLIRAHVTPHFSIFLFLLLWCGCFFSDFKNVSIVGHYVKDRTRDAQFIIIRYDASLPCVNFDY